MSDLITDAIRIESFREKIRRGGTGECWEWIAYRNTNGYGRFWDGSRLTLAHRWAYEVLAGRDIPEGLVIDHLCRNRACVNPDHLEPVRQGENLRRSHLVYRPDECRNGHPRTPGNSRDRGGFNHCLECERIRNRERYAEAERRTCWVCGRASSSDPNLRQHLRLHGVHLSIPEIRAHFAKDEL